MLAVVHPTYAIFLWIPFAGFLVVRAFWTREDVRAGLAALGALAIPASFFLLWLIPVVGDTVSVSPDRTRSGARSSSTAASSTCAR